MKKILVIIALILIILINYKESDVIIPKEAIRFRIIANSNSLEDQVLKSNLEKSIEKYLFELTKNSSTSDQARSILLKNQVNLNEYIKNYLKTKKSNESFKITIGKNYFPQKVYKNIKYDAGYYDSIVVTLGRGEGLNWWCVIYPPLCLIDQEQSGNIKYTTIVQELLNKYKL